MSWLSRWRAPGRAPDNGLGPGLVDLSEHEAERLRADPQLTCRALMYEQALGVADASISLAEARCLGTLVQGLDREGPIIEIGTFYGWSASVMALWKAIERPLITVDHYGWTPLGLAPQEKQRMVSRLLLEAAQTLNVEILAMDKSHFYSNYRGSSPALVFLDAIHTYEETKADIQWAQKVGAGTICGHDYSEQWPEVQQAVDEFGGPVQLVGSLWVLG